MELTYLKGHGTENDFLVLPDLDGTLTLTPELVARLCDRRAGLGADGVLRVVPSELEPEAAGSAEQARWFMDYRNADGSIAEMCGNGVRVYARYLVEAGLEPLGELGLAQRRVVEQRPDERLARVRQQRPPADRASRRSHLAAAPLTRSSVDVLTVRSSAGRLVPWP